MKKQFHSSLFPAVLVGVCLTGCGDGGTPPESPAERNQLVLRLFSSMEKKDAASAAAQAEKLRVLDPGNAYFRWIEEQQKCNLAVQQAQQMLAKGDYKAADALLAGTIRRYPLHRSLLQEQQKLHQLQELDQAVRAYQAAATLQERDQCLKRVENLTPLHKNAALAAAVAAQRRKLRAELAAASPKPAAPTAAPAAAAPSPKRP